MCMEERVVPREEENKIEQPSKDKKNDMRLYKAKIKFYLASGYRKETLNVAADSPEEAIDKIHSKYDQDMDCSYSHPVFIIKIKEVK